METLEKVIRIELHKGNAARYESNALAPVHQHQGLLIVSNRQLEVTQ